jgi:hypothetical protein
MLKMLIMSCIRGIGPFWQKFSMQYSVQAVDIMALSSLRPPHSSDLSSLDIFYGATLKTVPIAITHAT